MRHLQGGTLSSECFNDSLATQMGQDLVPMLTFKHPNYSTLAHNNIDENLAPLGRYSNLSNDSDSYNGTHKLLYNWNNTNYIVYFFIDSLLLIYNY